MNTTELSDEEMWDLASRVEQHHEIFYIIFGVNKICWSPDIPTLAVDFPKNTQDKPTIIINKENWNTIHDTDKEFLICHKCLHILLKHNVRNTTGIHQNVSHKLKNIAQDICINELLLSLFGFKWDDLTYCQSGCFVHTVFPNQPDIPTNRDFNYYLDLLVQKEKASPGSTDDLENNMDSHIDEPVEPGTQSISILSQIQLTQIAEALGNVGVDVVNKIVSGGTGAATVGSGAIDVLLPKLRPKKPFSFHRYIKDLKKSMFRVVENKRSTFTHTDRRYVNLMSNSNLHLPGSVEKRKQAIDKLDAHVFMDVSGSCVNFVPDFYKVFGHIEKNSEFFDVSAYTFNTYVTKVDLKQRNLRLGGGTNFQIIENKCLELKKYPDLVIVITDGDAGLFHCSQPKKWLWFLITPNAVTNCIHKNATIIRQNQIEL